MRQTLIEFLGTFFFVLVLGLTVVPPNVGPFAPLAVGIALAALMQTGGRGAVPHLNPAVTVAVWIRGRVGVREVLLFLIAQLVAGAGAALLVDFFRTGGVHAATVPGVRDAVKLLLVEFLFTCAVVYVFLRTTTLAPGAALSSPGLAVGFMVMGAMYAGMPLSGAALNPAVAIGETLMGLIAPGDLSLYLGATLLAGASAALLFRAVEGGGEEKEP
jgi:aquaporin Z